MKPSLVLRCVLSVSSALMLSSCASTTTVTVEGANNAQSAPTSTTYCPQDEGTPRWCNEPPNMDPPSRDLTPEEFAASEAEAALDFSLYETVPPNAVYEDPFVATTTRLLSTTTTATLPTTTTTSSVGLSTTTTLATTTTTTTNLPTTTLRASTTTMAVDQSFVVLAAGDTGTSFAVSGAGNSIGGLTKSNSSVSINGAGNRIRLD
jgi:hypothetical protein